MIEPIFKGKGHYLSRCHEWVGEPAPAGYLPGWSAASECWHVQLWAPEMISDIRRIGRRWIIAGFDRDAVAAAAEAKLAIGWVEWRRGEPVPEVRS